MVLEKVHHVRRTESAERGIQKARIDRHVAQNLLHIAVIAHVAAALARDKQFAANFFVGFQQRHLRACSAAVPAAIRPAAPPPITIMFNLYRPPVFIYVVFFPDALQLVKCLLNLIAALMPTDDQCVDDRQSATSESTKLAISLRASST